MSVKNFIYTEQRSVFPTFRLLRAPLSITYTLSNLDSSQKIFIHMSCVITNFNILYRATLSLYKIRLSRATLSLYKIRLSRATLSITIHIVPSSFKLWQKLFEIFNKLMINWLKWKNLLKILNLRCSRRMCCCEVLYTTVM